MPASGDDVSTPPRGSRPSVGRALRAAAIYARYTTAVLWARVARRDTTVFHAVYRKRLWGHGPSASGVASGLQQTAVIRSALPALFSELGVRSVLDAPCGDYHWLSHTRLGVQQYIGVDIASDLIVANTEKHGTEHCRFMVADICRDVLPKVDLILCRGCLVHFSNATAQACLRAFKNSGSTYLLTTTFPNRAGRNWDIIDGLWRAINLQRPPFNLPDPIRAIHEDPEGVDVGGRALGLWRLADLPI